MNMCSNTKHEGVVVLMESDDQNCPLCKALENVGYAIENLRRKDLSLIETQHQLDNALAHIRGLESEARS